MRPVNEVFGQTPCRWCRCVGYHAETCEGFTVNDPARHAEAFGSCADCSDGHTYEDRCRFRLDDDGTVLYLLSVTEIVL